MPSDELSKTSALGSGRRFLPTWRYLSLSRACPHSASPPRRSAASQPARLLAPPRSPCPFLVGFIFTYLLFCTGDSGTEGSDTIGASENTEDTYCSVLFTASPILRDVGVPISATFALFFPLLRRPVFTNSRAPYFMRLPSPYVLSIFPCYPARPTRLDVVITLCYCQKIAAP